MEVKIPVGGKETMPPNTVGNPLPQPNHNSNNSNNNDVKKRKPNNVDIHNSAFFKILALVQQLRPHFIEVLQTPDFHNCKPAYEIRKRMKLVMDLYKQMQVEVNPMGNYENMSACQLLSGEKMLGKEHSDGFCRRGPEHIQPNYALKKLTEKELPPGSISTVEKLAHVQPQGSYIVGGSVVGWNFIAFSTRKPPVYYGVTRESYRHNHKRSER